MTVTTGGLGTLVTVLVLAAATAALAEPSLAQDAAAEQTETEIIEEEALPATDMPEPGDTERGNGILVTAGKREQLLLDVPAAVSVVTAEQLERTQIRDLLDLPTLVPSLRAGQTANAALTSYALRGFGSDASNLGLEPSVAVFVDGVYRSQAISQLDDLPDVQRVEVLEGPQSVLYGKNASAGVIALVTREPRFEFGGAVEASYGNRNARVAKGYVTGPLGSTVAASLAAGLNQRDGYVADRGTGGLSDDRNRWFARGQVLVQPGGPLRIRLIGDYQSINETCCAVVNLRRSAATAAINRLGGQVSDPSAPLADRIWTNRPGTNRIKTYGLSGQIDYALGPITVTAITAWRGSRAVVSQDGDFSSADLIGADINQADTDTFTQELRVSASILDKFSVVAGASYFDETLWSDNRLAFGAQYRPYLDLLTGGAIGQLETGVLHVPLGTFQQAGQGFVDRARQRNRAYNLFGQIEAEVLPNLKLTLGGSFTRDHKAVQTRSFSTDTFSALDLSALGGGPGNPLLALRPLQFLPPFLNIPNPVEDGETSDGDWSWTVRLAYALSPSVKAYLGWSTGFKASAFNLTRSSRPFARDLAAVRAAGIAQANLEVGSRFALPEEAELIELGIKGNWTLASASLTLFRQSISDFQTSVFTGSAIAFGNAHRRSTFGAEFEGLVTPAPGLTFNLAMVWLDPRYDRYGDSPFGDISGSAISDIPKLSATLGAEFAQPLGADRLILRGDFHYEALAQVVEGLPGFITRAADGTVISYQSGIDAARPFRREINALDASLSYAMASGLELTLWGRNLLDDRDLTWAFDSLAQPGSISGTISPPRTWGLTARLNF